MVQESHYNLFDWEIIALFALIIWLAQGYVVDDFTPSHGSLFRYLRFWAIGFQSNNPKPRQLRQLPRHNCHKLEKITCNRGQ